MIASAVRRSLAPYLAFAEALRFRVLVREPEALRDELGTGRCRDRLRSNAPG